ncbi:MAG: pimeloyl-ACP methyl ester carboxylesterase [Planctomycetota bacterium]
MRGGRQTDSMRPQRATGARLSFLGQIRFLPMATCMILASCVLPPPAEDKPLTGKLDSAFHEEATVAPTLEAAGGAPGETGGKAGAAGDSAPEASGATIGTPAGAGIEVEAGDEATVEAPPGLDTAAERDPSETMVVEGQPSLGPKLDPVADVTDTVNPQAVEREPDPDVPAGVDAELEPKDLGATVADGERAVEEAAPGSAAPAGSSEAPASAEEEAQAPASEGPVVVPEGPFTVAQHETDDGPLMTYELGRSQGKSQDRGLEEGDGPPQVDESMTVVFIHGWCGNRSQWQSHMEKLVPDVTVVSVDLLGHGDSGKQERDEWTIPRYGRDVTGLIESLDLRDVVLVGHAMGGQVALEVALRLPDRIIGVVGVESLHELNVEPATSADPEGFKAYLQGFQDGFMKAFEGFIGSAVHVDTPKPIRERIARDARGCDKGVAIKLMKHFQTRDLKTIVRTIESPVFCINSKIFETDIKGNQELLPSFDAIRMDGVGYWPHLEAPESFQTELVLALKKFSAPKKLREPGTLTALRPVLFSDDIETLAAFYVNSLAFKELPRPPTEGEGPPNLITLERGEFRLQLQSLESLGADLPGVKGVTMGGQLLYMAVSNLDEERQKMGADVEMLIPVRTLESGSQQTVIRDPAGNVIVLQQSPRRE